MPSSRPIGFAVLGAGHWGPNHIRVFNSLPSARVVGVADVDRARLQAIQTQYPNVEVTVDWRELLARPDIDAVVVATPVSTHLELVREALLAGKDVLAEKPLASTSPECESLTALAAKLGRILMVGHVFLFNAGILKLREIIRDGRLGDLYYIHATRTNLGPIRHDTNAVGDLASHDIAILNYLLDASPTHVSGTGMSYLRSTQEDVAFVSMFYPGRVMANLHVSWLDPLKVRRITVVGSKKMAVWDELAPHGPVAVHAKHVAREPVDPGLANYGDFQLLVREGEINIPLVHQTEPLRVQALQFLDAVESRCLNISDGTFGRDVVRVVECINESIRLAGTTVRLSEAGTPAVDTEAPRGH